LHKKNLYVIILPVNITKTKKETKRKYYMSKSLKVPISAIAKLSKNISRPTLYKILKTRKDIVKQLVAKEAELSKFYDTLFASYKKEVYSGRTIQNAKIAKKS
jgi:hypothetical protein